MKLQRICSKALPGPGSAKLQQTHSFSQPPSCNDEESLRRLSQVIAGAVQHRQARGSSHISTERGCSVSLVGLSQTRELLRGESLSTAIDVRIRAGKFELGAVFERELAPASCQAFAALLPLELKLLHARWSGEAVWVPLNLPDINLQPESATSYPRAGQLLLYGGGISEPEVLIPYGSASFASKVGQLAGTHFMTIVEGLDQLRPLGERTLWHSAQDIRFDEFRPR